MTPQRAQELEAELRRLAGEAQRWHDCVPGLKTVSESAQAYTHAADLVRDAAKGEG